MLNPAKNPAVVRPTQVAWLTNGLRVLDSDRRDFGRRGFRAQQWAREFRAAAR